VPRILAHGEPGHVVNTCSMTSVIAAGNMYGICKHAILAMTEVLAADLKAAGANVGATGLCPGIIATNLFHGSRNRPSALTNESGKMSSAGRLAARAHARRVVEGHAAVGGGRPAGDGGAERTSSTCSPTMSGTPGLSPGTRRSWAGAVGPASTGMLDAEGV